MARRFELSERARSFQHAIRGLRLMLRSQHNAWIHAVVTVLALAAGLFFRISAVEWCLVVLAMSSVWAAEALNTAVEFLADATTTKYHSVIGKAKDVAAGAVLATAIGAALVGMIIFGPKAAELAGIWKPEAKQAPASSGLLR
jgi:diacylglycerol kinase (ATP)